MDNGEIVGVNPAKVQEQMDQLAKDMNNPQLFKLTYYLIYEPLYIDVKTVIYFNVLGSNQALNYKGTYYDRNQEGNFELSSTRQIGQFGQFTLFYFSTGLYIEIFM